MRRLSSALLCVGLLALMAIPATAFSQGGVQSGWTDSPPTINGKISAGEWSDATRVNLYPIKENGVLGLGHNLGDLTLGEEVRTEQVSGWARFMNDARYLYLAASLDIGAPGGDPDYYYTDLFFFFEDEPAIGDGKWAASLCNQDPDEGAFVSEGLHVPREEYDNDYFIPISEDEWCAPPELDPVGYSRAYGWGSINWEVRFDLTRSALDVAPGDCFNLGLLLGSEELYFDDQWDGWGQALWPASLAEGDPDSPDVFGQVCLAAPEEFVPEPGSVVLLGTGLAGLGGYAALRWRSRRRE